MRRLGDVAIVGLLHQALADAMRPQTPNWGIYVSADW
jgi:hypothetical protein